MRAAIGRLTGLGSVDASHVLSTLVPAEDTVFSYFLGRSAAAVVGLNDTAGVPFDRIVDAVAVTPAE